MQTEEVEKSLYGSTMGCVIGLGAIASSYVAISMWWAHILYTLFALNCDKTLLGVGFYLVSIALDRHYAWVWLVALAAQCYIWMTVI
jgi:hypothetical protein